MDEWIAHLKSGVASWDAYRIHADVKNHCSEVYLDNNASPFEL